MAGLVQRDGSVLRVPRALLISTSWALGAAGGVALGAVLTAVGGAGAPGLSGLDAGPDLAVAPMVVGGCVLAVHFGWTLLTSLVRGRRSAQHGAEHEQRHEDEAEDRIDREVEPEVPAADR